MDIKLGIKARAHARRAGAPWIEESNLQLGRGPHLFLDWRFVLPGELGLIGPYWASEEGEPIPLRLWKEEAWKDRPVDARYVPQDVPQGIRIVAQPAEKDDPFPAGGPPGGRIVYPGADDHHLMFPALYHHADDTSELRLFSSPDGIVWPEVPGGPVLSPGMPGSWDGGCVFGGLDLVPLDGDRVGLPYAGYLYPHKYPRNRFSFRSQIAYARWPAGRLGALEAPEEGRFTTLPLVFEGDRLVLNLQTRQAGYVLVEVADREGHPLPGRSFEEADPIVGDCFDRTVTWKGEADLKRRPDQPVLLRFRLRAAKLFAFTFGWPGTQLPG